MSIYSEAAKLVPRLAAPRERKRTTLAPTADTLQRRYLAAVLRYVSARIGAGAEAEDVTAEVFAAAFGALHRCPPCAEENAEHDPARAFLLGIARRKVADWCRRRRRRPEEPLPAEVVAAAGAEPEARFLAEEAARTLRALLAELPEPQAEALRLKYGEGLSLIEIGLILRKSPGAVSQLLHRARENARRRGAAYFGTVFDWEGENP